MLTMHFHLPQACIFPFSNSLSNIERGNGGADTYSEGITVMISYFCAFSNTLCFLSFSFPSNFDVSFTKIMREKYRESEGDLQIIRTPKSQSGRHRDAN